MALPTDASPAPRLLRLDAWRGLAALAVTWFHFTIHPAQMPAGWPTEASALGKLGLDAFFVLSGFVVPWLLWRLPANGPTLVRFWGRRLLRLHPPYVIALTMVFLLNGLSLLLPGYRGHLPPDYLWRELPAVAGDAIFLGIVPDGGWTLEVAWTLAYEFVFYAVGGALLLVCRPGGRGWVPWAVLIVVVGLHLLAPVEKWLTAYLPHFAIGTACAWALGEAKSYRVAVATAVLLVGLVASTLGVPTAVVVGLTVAVLLAPDWPMPRWLLGLGAISYSLYLVHIAVGGRVVLWLNRWLPPEQGWGWATALVAVAVSLGAAVVFWWGVERPFLAASRRWLVLAPTAAFPR